MRARSRPSPSTVKTLAALWDGREAVDEEALRVRSQALRAQSEALLQRKRRSRPDWSITAGFFPA